MFASLKLQNLWNWDRRRQQHIAKRKEKNSICSSLSTQQCAHNWLCIYYFSISNKAMRLCELVARGTHICESKYTYMYLSKRSLKLQNLWNCDTKGVGISQKRKEKIVACPRHNAHTSGFAAIISPLLRPWGWGYFFSLRSAFASRLAVRPKTVRLPLLPRH